MVKTDKRSAREFARRRANREAILHAAEAVIRRKGLTATSMDDVAAEAGFSKPTLYRYVQSKAELIFELSFHYLEDMDVQLGEILARPADPRDKLLEILKAVFRLQAEKENLTHLFLMDRSFLKLMHVFMGDQERRGLEAERKFYRRIIAQRRKIYEDAAGLFREGIETGVFRPHDVEKAVRFVGAVVMGYIADRFWNDQKANLESDVYDIYGFILQGIERKETLQGATS
jgi:AcrR family transcriptional regulator